MRPGGGDGDGEARQRSLPMVREARPAAQGHQRRGDGRLKEDADDGHVGCRNGSEKRTISRGIETAAAGARRRGAGDATTAAARTWREKRP